MTELTQNIAIARAVVAENAALITAARFAAGIASSMGVTDTSYAEYAQACLEKFPTALDHARSGEPDIDWEMCVDIAVQHELHKLHSLLPGPSYGPLILAAVVATSRDIRNTVYMVEKAAATLQ